MGKAAIDWTKPSGQSPASWPLRLAQQALASALERAAICPQLDVARLRNNAREALSALSADDRGQLERWICLLWRSRHGAFAQLQNVGSQFALRQVIDDELAVLRHGGVSRRFSLSDMLHPFQFRDHRARASCLAAQDSRVLP